MGQEWLGPSYFFISLVLGPLNSLLGYVPSSRYIWRLAPKFCFCKNKQKTSSSAEPQSSSGPGSLFGAIALFAFAAWIAFMMARPEDLMSSTASLLSSCSFL